MTQTPKWWKMTTTEVLEVLNSSEQGLSPTEAHDRLIQNGLNQLPSDSKNLWWKLLISQFTNGLLLILTFAALMAFFLGEVVESIVILSVIIINSGISFFQEYKAEKAIEKLKAFVAPKARVLRDGQPLEIDASQLVVGDLVFLHLGDITPADIRLTSVDEFSVNETALTGESLAVQKIIEAIKVDSHEPALLHNMAFMGTTAVSGSAQGIVVATGKDTYIGATAYEVSIKEPEADFQKNIRKFAGLLVKVMITMTVFVFVVNSLLGKNVFDSFLFAIALAVGITPEALPVIITITLSNGALKMAKKKVVVKKLASVEDLGNIDTLCCDKTGTLTEGKLVLEKFLSTDGNSDQSILIDGLLCTKIYGTNKHRLYGNPLDQALWQSPLSAKAVKQVLTQKILDENEFDFGRNRMSVI